jgi:uncharacterized protein (TIGR00369 family)
MNATITDKTAALRDSHRDCFACGIHNEAGLGLRFEIDPDGIASASWQAAPRFQSYAKCLHGGVIATLLDGAMVHALFAKGIAGVTAEMTIRYMRSVGLEKPLRVTGSVVAERHGLFLCRADVHQDGVHAARATAKFMSMPRPD